MHNVPFLQLITFNQYLKWTESQCFIFNNLLLIRSVLCTNLTTFKFCLLLSIFRTPQLKNELIIVWIRLPTGFPSDPGIHVGGQVLPDSRPAGRTSSHQPSPGWENSVHAVDRWDYPRSFTK